VRGDPNYLLEYGEQTYEWDMKDEGKMEGDEDTKWIKVQENGRRMPF
jgi:hypothetical protein